MERNIGIIGEASKRLLGKKSDIIITDIKKIVDTRNRIVHSYDSVFDEIIWSIITRSLPILNDEITALLNNQ